MFAKNVAGRSYSDGQLIAMGKSVEIGCEGSTSRIRPREVLFVACEVLTVDLVDFSQMSLCFEPTNTLSAKGFPLHVCPTDIRGSRGDSGSHVVRSRCEAGKGPWISGSRGIDVVSGAIYGKGALGPLRNNVPPLNPSSLYIRTGPN